MYLLILSLNRGVKSQRGRLAGGHIANASSTLPFSRMSIPTNSTPTEPVATDVSISFKRPVDNKTLLWNMAGFAAFGVGVRMWHLGIQKKSVYWSELSTTYFRCLDGSFVLPCRLD